MEHESGSWSDEQAQRLSETVAKEQERRNVFLSVADSGTVHTEPSESQQRVDAATAPELAQEKARRRGARIVSTSQRPTHLADDYAVIPLMGLYAVNKRGTTEIICTSTPHTLPNDYLIPVGVSTFVYPDDAPAARDAMFAKLRAYLCPEA
jgi:hypothetical protein